MLHTTPERQVYLSMSDEARSERGLSADGLYPTESTIAVEVRWSQK
jgi:hypothetical protein